MLPWRGGPSHPHSPGPNSPRSIPSPGSAGQAPRARDDLARSMWRHQLSTAAAWPHVTPHLGGAWPQGKGDPTVGLRTWPSSRKRVPPWQRWDPQGRGHPPGLDLEADVGSPVPGQVGDVDPIEDDVLHTAPEVLPVGEVLLVLVDHPPKEDLGGRGGGLAPHWGMSQVSIPAAPCLPYPPRSQGRAG